MILEIAVFNFYSAQQAAEAGAHRLELCENPGDGGTTPSYGTLKLVRDNIQIPVFPIIRPRGGDFLYNDAEFELMQQDIVLCKSLGFEGIVTGLLNIDGSIDTERTRKLVNLAYPLEVTFHRAFDRAIAPLNAMEAIIDCGCNRILTSGQVPNAMDGKALIKQLVEQAEDRIIIMPGSGVRSNNLDALISYTGAVEFHSSARQYRPSPMQHTNSGMQEDIQNLSIDADEIIRMKDLLKAHEY